MLSLVVGHSCSRNTVPFSAYGADCTERIVACVAMFFIFAVHAHGYDAFLLFLTLILPMGPRLPVLGLSVEGAVSSTSQAGFQWVVSETTETARNRHSPAEEVGGTVAKENPTSLGPLDPEIWAIEVWPIWPPAVKPSF
ncbi:hypothetical protein ACJJTC_014008 [Scirpophaga incertulas]